MAYAGRGLGVQQAPPEDGGDDPISDPAPPIDNVPVSPPPFLEEPPPGGDDPYRLPDITINAHPFPWGLVALGTVAGVLLLTAGRGRR